MINSNIDPYDVEVFFDGDCPLCCREIQLIQRRDKNNRIRFRDLTQLNFESAEMTKSYDELMAQMHGRLPDGRWIKGVEVFRKMYQAIGFGFLVSISRLPVISQILDLGYVLFARNRLRLTGRCTAESCSIHHPTASSETRSAE